MDTDSANTIPEPGAPAAPPLPRLIDQIVMRPFDSVLSIAKKRLNENFLNFNITWLTKFGHYALCIAAAIGLVLSLILSTKSDSFKIFLFGLGWVLVVLVLQYIAAKFIGAGETLIRSSPSRLSSPAFSDSIALLSLIVGFVGFIFFAISAIQAERLEPFWIGLCAVLIPCEYLACIAMNPKLLNISIDATATAGEEAIGALTFLMKGFLKLVPICFGSGAALGTLALALDAIGLARGADPAYMVLMEVYTSASLILGAALLPFAAYLVFLVYYLWIEVVRAILILPGKLNSREERGPGTP